MPASLQKPRRVPVPLQGRVAFPGERSIGWAIAHGFSRYNTPPWIWLSQQQTYVEQLLRTFLLTFIFVETALATARMKKDRARELKKWMQFDGSGCSEAQKDIESWSEHKSSHRQRWRDEARAVKQKFSPTAVRIRFARCLVDELRKRGVLLPRENTVDCKCCLGTFRPDLAGMTRWRLAVPCGHWCCDDPCGKELEAVAMKEREPMRCPECRHVIMSYKTKEFRGQCVTCVDDDSPPIARGCESGGEGGVCAAELG